MMKRLIFALALLVLLATVPAFSTNLFVKPASAGSANGTDWNNALGPTFTPVRGNTYYYADGSYAAKTFNTVVSGTTLITINKCTTTDGVSSLAAGYVSTDCDGQAVFTNQVIIDSSYWVFDGITGGGPDTWTTGFGFKVSSTSADPLFQVNHNSPSAILTNITFRHITGIGNNNSTGGGNLAQDAFAVYGGQNITVSYFYFDNVGRCPFFISTRDFVAEYGYTGFFFSGAAHAEIASIWNFAGTLKITNVTFRYNLFRYSTGTGGLVLDDATDITLPGLKAYGNVFYEAAGETWEFPNGLIAGWTGGGGEKYYNNVAYNNTFLNTKDGAFGDSILTTFPNLAGNNIAQNNLFYNIDTLDCGVFNVCTFNTTAGVNPVVNMAALNFRLVSATAAGTPITSTASDTYNIDMYGNVRGADGTWDRGAIEFVTGGATPSVNIVGTTVISGGVTIH